MAHKRHTDDWEERCRLELHVHGFMTAVAETVPEVFDYLAEHAVPILTRVDGYEQRTIPDVFDAEPTLMDRFDAWRASFNLNATHPVTEQRLLDVYTMALIRLARGEAAYPVNGAPVLYGRPVLVKLPAPAPPRYRDGESKEDYLRRAAEYWGEAEIRERPAFKQPLDRIERTEPRGNVKIRKAHYRWAAYYQCSGATLTTAAEHFEVLSDQEFYTHAVRTLRQCGLDPRKRAAT